MKTHYEFYKDMEKQLLWCRLAFGPGSKEENPIVDIMCDTWYKLTNEEQDKLNGEGAKCFPSSDFLKYEELTKNLLKLRENKEETIEETKLLDEMDIYWYNMKEDEREYLKASNRKVS